MMVRALCFLCTSGLLGLSATTCGASAVLTEEAVYQLADDIAKASEAKDINGILRHMSKSVTIETKKRGKPNETMDLEHYHARLKRLFPLISYYRYIPSKEAVTINDDGRSARFRFNLEERYVVKGRYARETHVEEWLVVLDGGAPRVQKVLVN